MLSGLFATEACYAIKEKNKNKKNSFYGGKLPFCRRKLPLFLVKIEKGLFEFSKTFKFSLI